MQMVIILPEWEILSKPIFRTSVYTGPQGHGAQLFKLSESWSKFRLFDFNEMFKSLREGQQKVPWVTKIHIFLQLGMDLFRVQASR
jgi:hypothetical protein